MFGNPNQVFEFFSDSDAVTCEAAAAITGKTFVKLTTGGKDQVPRVVTCGAGERPYGVAGWDVASGAKVTVIRKGILTVTVGAALTAAAAVSVGADGKAVAAAVDGTTPIVGDVHADTALNADAAVALSL